MAVKGVVLGVTRSVRLRGRAPEYFSVLVDPRALVEGRNELQVLTVERSRGRLLLRRIFESPRPPVAPEPLRATGEVLYPRPSDG